MRIVNRRETRKTESRTNTLHRSHIWRTRPHPQRTGDTTGHTRDEPTYPTLEYCYSVLWLSCPHVVCTVLCSASGSILLKV